MEPNEQRQAVMLIYQAAARENPEALNFLLLFDRYCHKIDDFIDNKLNSPEKFLDILADANLTYSTPFYQQNAQRLHMVVALITNAFADSLKWAGDREKWRQAWADTLRLAGNDMVLAVAMINGGTTLMREISADLREIAWHCHHAEDGTPE